MGQGVGQEIGSFSASEVFHRGQDQCSYLKENLDSTWCDLEQATHPSGAWSLPLSNGEVIIYHVGWGGIKQP